ncbi:MAG TPA: hypothetical protein VHS31_00310 [Tepidisphaeraceae bacterium]|jgi:hypothetical protein|nr:hypothetical protein [Tepidisphaeraceae bacterium]
MKHSLPSIVLAFIVLLSTCCLAGDGQQAAAPDDIFIRLVSVSHTGNEVPLLFARFVPVKIDYGGGGGRDASKPFGSFVETKAGEEFRVTFRGKLASPHDQTLCNVLSDCEVPHGSGALKLDLLLSVPADVPTASDDSARDLSQWIVKSIGIHK